MSNVLREIIEHVKTILRRDLKLGPNANIPDDMAFFNSEVDLDSLDMLLLVTSIEKEFGLKIPSEQIGREVFQNVTTLAKYIAENGGGTGGTTNDRKSTNEEGDYLSQLPHAEPFRFVSRIVEIKPGESGIGIWDVRGNEAFFAGHFPGNPIVPGVLIAEALGQFSGIVGASASGGTGGKLAHVDVRFEEAVAPPVEIMLRSKKCGGLGKLSQYEVSAEVTGKIVARGTMALVIE